MPVGSDGMEPAGENLTEGCRLVRGVATYETYRGLTLPEALLELVDQHGNERTRHLSQYERKLLEVAADWLDRNGCRTHVPQLQHPCTAAARVRLDCADSRNGAVDSSLSPHRHGFRVSFPSALLDD